MGIPSGSTGRSAPEYTSKLFVMALLLAVLTPLMFSLFVPTVSADAYEEEIAQIEEDYYLSTGSHLSSNKEIWPLVGVYTAYDGTSYGVSPDGWIYGEQVLNYAPVQYQASTDTAYSVRLMDNGLYYYTTVADNDLSHKKATYNSDTQTWDYSDASVYSAVTMDNNHKSDMFFTPEGKTETAEGFYYYFSGYRYAFSPIRAYNADDGGKTIEIQPYSSSLSLIWYQYSSLSGLAGMLSVQGTDGGLSYLTSSDIVKAFNGATYSSTFDMTFNNIKMHLTIRLDPVLIAGGMSPADCYNGGYWSVVVSSDSVASANVGNASYNLSIDNIWQTMIDLFTFNLAEDYDIEGWEATVASLIVSMPLYAALLSLALSNYYILIGVALLGAIQTATNWWPF